jgi:8-amino-7-oxononanoate synthase
MEADVDFIVGTFSKSLGAIGGFCVSDVDDFDILRVVSRPYMFTASLPPAVVASTLKALERAESDRSLRPRLQANSQRLHDGLNALGFATGPQVSPIVAVVMPDMPTALSMWNQLLKGGVYLNLALPPATPNNRPLLRSSVSAAHTTEQIDQVLAAFEWAGRELGLLPAQTQRASG